ncbi:hypothetical protein OQA88_5352 [Cercophora sp. LCS_1]
MDSTGGLFNGAPSSRVRVLKHISKQKEALLKSRVRRVAAFSTAASQVEDEDPEKPKELPPNSMQLFSFYAPSLQGGVHEIEVVQDVIHPTDTKQEPLHLVSTQKFNVNTPRFTLPPGIVHSTYPPQGLGDHNNILPHMVFNDPHLPWERQVSPDLDKQDTRNKVPWLALLTFTEDELKLGPELLKGKGVGGLFPDKIEVPPKTVPSNPDEKQPDGIREQNISTFFVQLTMKEYLEMGGKPTEDPNTKLPTANPKTVITPIIEDKENGAIDGTTQVDVIFPKGSLINQLLSSYDSQGEKKTTAKSDLSRFKYLAHVRNVNTKDVANAGLDDNGLFSIIHAHRSGPLNLTSPKPIIVHLITLEGFEDNLALPLEEEKRVALVSLHSWTYLCLPPDEVNFVDSMRSIGFSIENNTCWLRTPEAVIDKVNKSTKVQNTPAALATRLAKRMTDGFCLQRYILHTGEETMAFYRSPLTPCFVPPIEEAWWPTQSNFSTDYQVLDKSLGIMDITYSAAWQLGRTLGIANQAFTAALVRLRTSIQTTGRREALKKVAPQSANSKTDTLASVSKSVDVVSALAAASTGKESHPPAGRHSIAGPRKPVVFLDKSAGNDKVPSKLVLKSFTQSHISLAAEAVGSAHPDQSLSGDDEVLIPFNELNVPKSSDWHLVQSWILDNMFLKNIPAHYLIPDPSYLPPESIRFFYIDNNWMDAFIDGALSIGNHLDRADDAVRQGLKNNLNRYFKTELDPVVGSKLNYRPQIPCFGFLLRSSVVRAFPDLQIHAPWFKPKDDKGEALLHGEREPVLRFETIDKDTLLCLFDRMPGSKYWEESMQITLSQPPHQQCFSLGGQDGLDSDQVAVSFQSTYTTIDNPVGERYDTLRTVKWSRIDPKGPHEPSEKGDKLITDVSLPKAVFDWTSRCVIFPAFAEASQKVIAHGMAAKKHLPGAASSSTKFFDEPAPTSALTATVLTSRIAKMKVNLPPATTEFKWDPVTTPRSIRLPPPSDSDPSTWIPIKTSPKPPVIPPPNKPSPPAHTSTPVPPKTKPTGLPSSYNPDAVRPPSPFLSLSSLQYTLSCQVFILSPYCYTN